MGVAVPARLAAVAAKSIGVSVHAALFLLLLSTSTSGALVFLELSAFYSHPGFVLGDMGEGARVVVSSPALAPYTSMVNYARVAGKVEAVEGVVGVVPVAVSLSTVKDRVVVVLGLREEDLSLLGARLTSGGRFRDCLGCIWVGEGVREYLGVELGEIVPVCPLYPSKTCYAARVEGFFDAPEPYRYEVLAGLDTGRMLRGLRGDQASIVVVLTSSPSAAERVAAAFNASVERGAILSKVFLVLERIGRGAVAKAVLEAGEAYAYRLQAYRHVVLALGVTAAGLAMTGALVIGRAACLYLGEKLGRPLRAVGVGYSSVKAAALLLVLAHSVSTAALTPYTVLLVSTILDLRVVGIPLYLLGEGPTMGWVAAVFLALPVLGVVSCRLGGEESWAPGKH